MDDNFFDPSPSPNLDPADPLREWASQLQDPEIAKLMATDPKAAAQRLSDLGIPPPPDHIHAYTDGLGAENNVNAFNRNLKGTPGTFGGDPALQPATPDTSAPIRTKPDGTIAGNISDDPNAPIPGARPGSLLDKLLRPTQPGAPVPAPEAVPLPASDPRKSIPNDFDPATPPAVAETTPLPQARPAEAGPGASDLSAQKKKKSDDLGDALGGFSKSLSGVKPIAPPAPNFVGTPSVRGSHPIGAPNLQNLLSLVGQPQASPLSLTLGRLLATGKA